MVEKSMFIDKRHSPMIELTKIEARIILYWLELQANAYWRKGGAPKSCDNIEQIYNKLQDLVRNRKTQNKKWRWLEEPKSRLVRQREYNKQYRERQKEAKKKAEQHEHNWVETPFILEKGNRCTVCGRLCSFSEENRLLKEQNKDFRSRGTRTLFRKEGGEKQ